MGAIAPQRRISKTRKRQRRSHFKLDNPSMMVCPNCGEIKLAHIVCSACGYYDGKLVKEIKVKKEEETEVKEAEETKKVSKKSKKATKTNADVETTDNANTEAPVKKSRKAKKVEEDK